jgi:hypothetical protein
MVSAFALGGLTKEDARFNADQKGIRAMLTERLSRHAAVAY